MKSKFKSIGHSKSKTPSPSPPTSRSHSKCPNPKQEVVKKPLESTTMISKKSNQSSSIETPEVHSLIHKLQGISISQEESELSQATVSSQFPSSQRLTRAQSEKFGILPFEFPLPNRKRAKKTQSESHYEVLSSSPQTSSFILDFITIRRCHWDFIQ